MTYYIRSAVSVRLRVANSPRATKSAYVDNSLTNYSFLPIINENQIIRLSVMKSRYPSTQNNIVQLNSHSY